MRRIDDFLIDRVFQPLADALAWLASCYGIAAFLLTGFGVEHVVYYVYQGEPVWIAVAGSWLVPLIFKAHRLDRQAVRNVMPIERITGFLWRTLNLLLMVPLTVVGCVLEISQSRLGGWVTEMAWVMAIAAQYFLACRKHPPTPKLARMPDGAYARSG